MLLSGITENARQYVRKPIARAANAERRTNAKYGFVTVVFMHHSSPVRRDRDRKKHYPDDSLVFSGITGGLSQCTDSGTIPGTTSSCFIDELSNCRSIVRQPCSRRQTDARN